MPSILFLPGLKLSEILDNEDQVLLDMIDSSLATDVESGVVAFPKYCTFDFDRNIYQQYDPIPTCFTDLDHWPKVTNLLCWFCDGIIHDIPWAVPLSCRRTMVDGVERTVMDTRGIFCGPVHTRMYIHEYNDPAVVGDRSLCDRLLYRFAKILLGRDIKFIPMGENKFRQAKYCGPNGISEEFYRHQSNLKLD